MALLLALAAAGMQPGETGALLATAAALALHGSDHAHAVSLVTEHGHRHLVLSHEGGDAHDHGGAPAPDGAPESFSEDEHVLHLSGDELTSRSSRRTDPAPLLAIALARPPAPPSRLVPRAAPEPRAQSSDPLETVVLRL